MSGVARFWWRWLAATAVLLGVVIGILALNGSTWRFWPLLLLVAFTTSVLALVNVGTVTESPDWSVDSGQGLPPAGQDSRLGMYTRAISGHLDAREPDPTLRDRLAALADRRLRQRHGITLTDPRARRVLGDDAAAVLTGPVRRLSRGEIETCVTRIEEL